MNGQEKNTLYVHIGTGKTGSSSIQNVLRQAQDKLRDYDLIIPCSGRLDLSGKFDRNHGLFFRSREDNVKRIDEVAAQWRVRIADLEGRDGPGRNLRILLSCEGFSHDDIPSIRSLADSVELNVKIIVYLRRQDDYLESSWRQWGCKVCDDVESWAEIILERGQCDWERRLEPWAEAFGDDALIVRPFDRAQMYQHDVVADFFRIIDVPREVLGSINDLEREVNTAQHPDLVQITNLCRHLLNGQNDNRLNVFFNKNLGRLASDLSENAVRFTPPELSEWIQKAHSESNERLARRFCLDKSKRKRPNKAVIPTRVMCR